MSQVPKVLYCFPQCAGQSFRPSNGTEGMMFMDAFCDNCLHEKWSHTHNDHDKKCPILSATMLYDKKEKGYPEEWVYNDEGWPVCTAWHKWDWGNDGDPDDPDNPNYRPPDLDNPNQLCLPFLFDEIGIPKTENIHA